MLNGRKIITIGLVVTFGIVNGPGSLIVLRRMRSDISAGYYTFAPSLREEKEKCEGLNLG